MLHAFQANYNGEDGANPVGGLITDSAGNLYGTTYYGGIYEQGAAFMLEPTGAETVLASFGKRVFAFYPVGGLAMDAAGNLYGTTAGVQDAKGYQFQGALFTLLTPSASTTTTLASSPNPSTHGQTVTFTAAVASSAGTPANGETVSFMKGKTVLGKGTLTGGSANFTTSKLKVGTTSVTAVYGGDPTHTSSTSNTVQQVVEKAAK